jgi:hypothetical protein
MLLVASALAATPAEPPPVSTGKLTCPERTVDPPAAERLREAVALGVDADAQSSVVRVDLVATVEVRWNVGEGYAECVLAYDATGLASRTCRGQYVSHSMGDANTRSKYATVERFLDGKRVGVGGTVDVTVEATGEREVVIVDASNAARWVDGYFDAPPKVDPVLLAFLNPTW